MFALGADANLCTSADYTDANLWSLAIHDHPGRFDGIIYRSRYTNGEAVAIFDRANTSADTPPIELEAAPDFAPFLDRYNIALT